MDSSDTGSHNKDGSSSSLLAKKVKTKTSGRWRRHVSKKSLPVPGASSSTSSSASSLWGTSGSATAAAEWREFSSRSMGPASRSFSKADISSKELQVVAAAVEEKAKPLDEKKDPCLFAKRTNSMELERKSSVRNSFSEKTMAARVRQAFTVNKLPFHSVGLQGRDNEVLILSRCLEQQRQMGQRQKQQQEESNQPTVFRQVVWIAGDSGTGKTKLASSLKQQVRRTTNKGAFVMGKFDLLQHSQNNNEPYTGIVAACRNLCLEYILPAMRSQQHNNQHALSLLRDQIVRDLQMCPVLFHLIPELEFFWQTECSTKHQQQLLLPLPPQNMTMTTTTTTTQEAQEHKQRFLFAFRTFISVISSHFSPLVLLLDDLQWADMASLELLEALVLDKHNPNLMIVGCYRSNEVSETHSFSKLMRDLHNHHDNIQNQQSSSNHQQSSNTSSSNSSGFSITEIPIGNLTERDVNHILSHLLDKDDDPEATLPLAKICHRKTQGNAFFVHSFLSMLEKENMLSFHLSTLKWTWNLEDILINTAATENVVQLTAEKINRLPPRTCQLLQVVSCLGSTFSERTVHLVWKHFCFPCDRTTTNSAVTSMNEAPAALRTPEIAEAETVKLLLSQAIDEWFLERVDDDSQHDSHHHHHHHHQYRWVHDKVQEAAISLIPPEQLNATKFQVGRILQQQLTEQEVLDNIFEVTNLLNNNPLAMSLTVEERVEIAKLDLQAAKKAKRLSAFKSAAEYVAKGIALLVSSKDEGEEEDLSLWRTPASCKLLVDMYSTGAEAEYVCGNTQHALAYCDQVLRHQQDGGLSISDLLRIYQVQIYNLGERETAAVALHLILFVLEQLGCKLPKYQITRDILALRFFGGSRAADNCPSRDQISQLRPMEENPIRKEMMKLLVHQGCEYAHYAKKIDYLAVMCMRGIQWTLQYGMCESTPLCFALAAIFLVGARNFAVAGEYAELALLAQSKINSQVGECVVTCIAHGMVWPWISPGQNHVKPLLKAYKSGTQTGDNGNAGWSIFLMFTINLLSGKALPAIEEDCKIYVPPMRDLDLVTIARICSHLWQVVLNLMVLHPSENHNTVILTGSEMDEEAFLETTSSEQLSFRYFQVFKMYAYTYFGDYEIGAEYALKIGDDFTATCPGTSIGMCDPFLRGICLYDMARKRSNNKKRKQFTKAALKARSTIHSWLKKGNPNVKHYAALLDAEHAAMRGRKEAASEFYKDAILLAARFGFVQDAGLANERYASFLLDVARDEDSARYHLEEAIRYYRQWGASKKVSMLMEGPYSHLLGKGLKEAPREAQDSTDHSSAMLLGKQQ